VFSIHNECKENECLENYDNLKSPPPKSVKTIHVDNIFVSKGHPSK